MRTHEDVVDVLRKGVKRRRESVAACEQAGRADGGMINRVVREELGKSE